MSSRLQLAVILFFELTVSSLLQCLAETPEEGREIAEANALPDKQAMIKHLDNYLLIHPNSARVVGFRAEVYNCLGRDKEIIRDASRYFELNKEAELPVIYKVRAHAYFKLGEFSKALHDLDAAKKLDAKDGDIVFMRALVFEQLGRSQEALAEYSCAIGLKCERAYLNKGYLEFKLHRRQAAVADCVSYVRLTKVADVQEYLAGYVRTLGIQDSLALYDGLIAAKVAKQFVYVDRAQTILKLGDFSRALKEFEYCEKAFGLDFAETRFNILCRLGQHEKALALVNKLIARSPSKLNLYVLRAGCYMSLQNYDLALADLDRADALAVKDLEILRKRAECEFRNGKYVKAEVDFAKGNSCGATVKSLTFEGLNFKALKKYTEAVRCFTSALKIRPLSSDLLGYRADCYFRMNDYGRCDSDLSDAIALNGKNHIPALYFSRGTCRLAAGNAESAVQDLTVSLSDINLHSVAYAARAKAFAKLGKNNLAANDLRASGAASKGLEVDLFKQ